MKLDVDFDSCAKRMNAVFAQSSNALPSAFGDVQTIHDGQNGATFTPAVSDDGVVSWTNDRGLPNPEPVNIKGTKGDKGDKGDRGLQGVQGVQGERGEQGQKGDKGDTGPAGKDGTPGNDGVSATHRWSGTTLYVTSASGTSSANLKGDKGDPGAAGSPGKDGQPGADGVSPVVAVTDIDGGHRVTITDKDGAKEFDVMNGKDGEGGSGGGTAIIDVVQLPTDNINENAFYRLLTGTFVYNQFPLNAWTCHSVETLPEVGEPVTLDMVNITAYYDLSTNDVYGYLNDALASQAGVPTGWYTMATLAPIFGVSWSGIITDILDDPKDDSFRLFLEYVVYSYKEGNWTSHKKIGWVGDGPGAEVFNHPSNKAYGSVSHAEGRFTAAGKAGVESYGDHAEGDRTIASGGASHAEGYKSESTGSSSHAEGNQTHASGVGSHAEGFLTTASGDSSHTEGEGTVANGRGCHVQGRFNIIENVPGNPHVNSGKYAHIVGNGKYNEQRSNAHTLDWNGLGWFAGGLKVGGTGQDDENAVAVLTAADMSTITQNVIASLPIYNGEVIEQ